MTQNTEEPHELNLNSLDSVTGGDNKDIRTPAIPVDSSSKNTVRSGYLYGQVSSALQHNKPISSVLALCKNEQERAYVQKLAASM